MKVSLDISKSIFDDYLRDFESAEAVYVAAEREFVNFDLDHGTSDEMKSVREKLQSARDDRDYRAVVFCKYLRSCKDFICFEANPDVLEDSPADAPEDSPVDASEVAPVDAPEDSPVDTPENVVAADPVSPADAPEDSPVDAPEVAPADAPEDSPVDALENVVAADPVSPADVPEDIFPVMSAKCRLCPSCVDGRCFFVPDIYDSEFPCQSSAWDNFFKSGGSHGPAP